MITIPTETPFPITTMKSLLLSFAAFASMTLVSGAAVTLNSTNFGNGLVTSNNAALASGSLRFGTFPALFDFTANSANLSALETAFTEVYAYNGPITAFATSGFFEVSQSIDNTASFEGVSYAASIAGQRVFLWVLNPGATEHAIFSTNTTWNSGVGLPPFNTNFSPDTGTPGLTVHVGTAAAGPDIGAGAPSHRLAVVPEPSASLLGGLAVAGLLVRRRR